MVVRHAVVAAALLLALALPTAGATAGSHDPLSAEERAWLADHGPIRYGYEPGYAPFEFRDRQGHAVGINFDLLDAVGRSLDVRVEKIEYPDFDALQDGIRDGSLDVIGTVNQTPERETFLDFTNAYVRLSSAFYVTDDHADVRGIHDLAGLRVGIVESYVSGQWLVENHPEMDIQGAPDLDTLLAWLATNQVDAVFEETATLGYLIRENGLTHVRVLDDGPFLQSDQHWAVPDGEAMLVSILNKGMARVPPGERTQIFEYWTHYDLGIHPPAATGFSPLARNTLIATLGAIVAIGAWSLALRHRVKAATKSLREELDLRHAAEASVRRLNRRLEARVQERTEQLQQSNEDLEQFARTVSHDLQSPLSVIRLNVGVVANAPEAARARCLDRIDRTITHMETLIQSTLAYSRANAKHEPEPMDLTKTVQQAACLVVAECPNAIIDVDELPDINASRAQIRQLFQNLIGNALKYRRDGETPRVRIWSDADAGTLRIHVEDNGIGMDAARLDELMQPFRRQEKTEERPGYGLGLAACARILQRHGGHLTATSDGATGSTLTVVLPLSVTELWPNGHGAFVGDPCPEGCDHQAHRHADRNPRPAARGAAGPSPKKTPTPSQ